MATEKYILALDQGTTSSRAIIFNNSGKIISSVQKEFSQFYPKPGWVEHDPEEIWSGIVEIAKEAIGKAELSSNDIAAIGIANQRETTIVWDRITGNPIYPAIVWQDRRTASYCDELTNRGLADMVRSKTGLVIDAYFSATKINWILDNVSGARGKAENGELYFGTIDSWLVWKFSNGEAHITDISNASRTMLFNIHSLKWDRDLLKLFNIPLSILPEVKSSSEIFCETSPEIFGEKIPIAGILGDQQAALFGQLCHSKGMAKTTYGTGCFLVLNTGDKPVESHNNLLTTIAWQRNGKVIYALEGSIFIGGAVIQWLRDGLKIIGSSEESEKLALSIPDNGGVYFVPALTGLGAPHWDPYARGSIFGISRGTTNAHICRAALESICFQVYDIIAAMIEDADVSMHELRVDGGAVSNNFLMQFQSDILGTQVIRPEILETTALGVAYMAGLTVGFWKNEEELHKQWKSHRVFSPEISREETQKMLNKWNKALSRSKNWID